MSTLNDFFGDSTSAIHECLYCGGVDGELVVAIRDANGATHWQHAACAKAAAAEAERVAEVRRADLKRSEQHDRDEHEA